MEASGTFNVNSYQVWLGSEELFPSCQCKDYNKHKLPCKHICAVINHPGIGWDSIGSSLRNHPCFNLDPLVVSPHLGTNHIGTTEDFPGLSHQKEKVPQEKRRDETQTKREECLRINKELTDELYGNNDLESMGQIEAHLNESLEIARKKRNGELSLASIPSKKKNKNSEKYNLAFIAPKKKK